jgi:hypothetical protein
LKRLAGFGRDKGVFWAGLAGLTGLAGLAAWQNTLQNHAVSSLMLT